MGILKPKLKWNSYFKWKKAVKWTEVNTIMKGSEPKSFFNIGQVVIILSTHLHSLPSCLLQQHLFWIYCISLLYEVCSYIIKLQNVDSLKYSTYDIKFLIKKHQIKQRTKTFDLLFSYTYACYSSYNIEREIKEPIII